MEHRSGWSVWSGQSARSGSPENQVIHPVSGEHSINLNPLFISVEENDYHLQEVSPCIDSGTMSGAPERDLENTLRPRVGSVDMGV